MTRKEQRGAFSLCGAWMWTERQRCGAGRRGSVLPRHASPLALVSDTLMKGIYKRTRPNCPPKRGYMERETTRDGHLQMWLVTTSLPLYHVLRFTPWAGLLRGRRFHFLSMAQHFPHNCSSSG